MSRPTTITTFVPFSTWSPDLGIFSNPGLVRAFNMVPFGDGGLVTPGGHSIAHTLAATPIGLGSHVDTSKLFYGATAALYDFVVGGAEEDRSGAVYTAEALPIGWRFLGFGGDIIATGGLTQRPQYMDADAAAGTNFADLLDATTLARTDLCPRYACCVGQHIMIGNLRDAFPAPDVDYPDRVWLSAINNARRFGTQLTDPALLTTYQDLYDDYGHITGLSGGNDYAYIFKHRAIYRMDFAGPFGLTFKPVSIGAGCGYPRSIIEVSGDIYFWSKNGPAVIRQGGTVVHLASTAMSRQLLDDELRKDPQSDYLFVRSQPHAWHCAHTRCVCWSYHYEDAVGAIFLAHLVHNTDTGKWSLIRKAVPLLTGVGGVATRADLGSAWEFGSNQYVAASNKSLYVLTGTQRESASAKTPYIVCRELLGDKYTTAKIVRVRPRLRMIDSGFVVTVTAVSYNEMMLGTAIQTTTGNSDDNIDGSGHISLETDIAQAFTLQVDFTFSDVSAVLEFDGVEVEFDVSATKGP